MFCAEGLQQQRYLLAKAKLLCRTCGKQITGYKGICKCKSCHHATTKKNREAMKERMEEWRERR